MFPRLRDQDFPLRGTLLSIPSPVMVELLGITDFDFVILDMEHGEIDLPDLPELLRAADARNLPAVVRVPQIEREPILKSLDRGASGIMVPQVESVSETETIVEHVKYAPQGSRGVILPRAGDYGDKNLKEYLDESNENTFVVIQCESTNAVKNVSSIAGVPGVDVVSVGPLDLSQSMGIPGEVGSVEMEKTIQQVGNQVTEAGSVPGISVADGDELERRLEQQYQFLIYSMDTVLLRERFSQIRAEFESRTDHF